MSSSPRILFLSLGTGHTGPSTWKCGLIESLLMSNCKVTELNTSSLYALFSILTLTEHEVIHVYHTSPVAMVYVLTARLLRKKVIFTVHGDIKAEKVSKRGIKRLLWVPFHKIMFRMADIVTFPTTFIQKRIVVDFPTVTHHVVIFNGISITPCTYTLSRHSPVRILAITNFNHAEKARGISLLCDALEAVRAMGIPTTLTIVGGGTYFSQYKEKYTGENIIFLGFKEHATSYFYTHDVFVHATFLDNAPYTILEAVASCIPTVSVSIGGIPELLPHTSCAEPTVESLATILESLLTSPYACEENVRTNQVMLRQFDWKTISNAYVQLYSS